MIVDAEQLPEELASFQVLVVGSGVNGSLLAQHLGRLGVRTALLEAGGDGGDDAEDDQWRAEVGDQPFAGAEAGRRRGFGGTGAWWAGQCAPFDALDFEERPWVPASGWPLTLDDLGPWYASAQEALGIPGEAFGTEHWRRHRVPAPPTPGLEHKFSAFIPHPDVAAGARRELARSTDVMVVLHATVVEVRRRPEGDGVGAVRVALRSGRRRDVCAGRVVLAAGGVETPRLLLASRSTDREGLGNAEGLVGRYLQDHPNGIAARVRPLRPRLLQDMYAMSYGRRTRHWARMPLPEDAQRQHELVGATANAVFEHDGDGPVGALKRVVRQRIGRDPLRDRSSSADSARDLARALPAVPAVLWRRYGRGLSPAQEPESVWLRTAAEQPPRPQSRVVLSDRRDALGQPLARVEWVVGEEERRAQQALVTLIGEAWSAVGLAEVEPLPWLSEPGDAWKTHQVDAYHHSGTTRMATSARRGVVDANLQVHGVRGLYVAGSAVFPTSGHANPTFTSAALSLRLADHLSRRET